MIDNADDVDRLVRLGRAAGAARPDPRQPGRAGADATRRSTRAAPEAKFGVPLGQAPALIERVAALDGLELLGLHVHIGSQLLDLDGFGRAAEAIAALGRFPVYDLGGGLGISYTPEERAPAVADYAEATVRAPRDHLDPEARLIVEPGRSMVGRSGATLYSVVTVKRGAPHARRGRRRHGRQPRARAYGTRFAAAVVDRPDRPAERPATLVGHHCESGDVLAGGIDLATPEVDDLLVVAATGGYCYSMWKTTTARAVRPVVLARDGDARLAVRREEMRDLLARDVL